MSDFNLGVSNSVIAQFSDFLEENVKPRNTLTIEPDGQIHRFTIEGDNPSTKNGAYALYLDGKYQNNLPAGYVQNWKTGDKFTWKYEPSDDERKEYGRELHNAENQAQREKEHKERERRQAEEKRLQEENQVQARAMALAEYKHSSKWTHETGLIQHSYWKRKFEANNRLYLDYIACRISGKFPIARVVNPYGGGICKAGELLVPMLNILTGEFQSLIHIPTKPTDEGKFLKLIYTSTSITGAGHWLISANMKEEVDTILVAEGITTAIAVVILTRGLYPVISVGACHNLKHVCERLTKRYPKKKTRIMADNDEAGITAAHDCINSGFADSTQAAPNSGGDWYDYLLERTKRSC